jgi:hypothetical protein
MGLTRPFLLDLFGHQSECGQYFHHYFDAYLRQGCRGRHFGVTIEAAQEVFDGLQQINERIIARVDVLECLRNLVATGICRQGLRRTRTASRIFKPANTAPVYENGYRKKQGSETRGDLVSNVLDTPYGWPCRGQRQWKADTKRTRHA